MHSKQRARDSRQNMQPTAKGTPVALHEGTKGTANEGITLHAVTMCVPTFPRTVRRAGPEPLIC